MGNENTSIEAAVTGIIDQYEIKPQYYRGDLDPEKIVCRKIWS